MVYGDLNLNYIDGSAVWAVSLVEVLAGVESFEVDFLLKARLQHNTLIEPLYKFENISIINPAISRMTPKDALKKIEELDRLNSYDAIIIRGFDLAKEVSNSAILQGRVWPYVTDIPQEASLLTPELSRELEKISKSAYRMFCQTEYAREFLEENILSSKNKTVLLNPMIPDVTNQREYSLSKDKIKIVYAGKFAPLWASREMFKVFIELKKRVKNIELHIFGDKIHNPKDDPSFKKDIEKYLTKTKGVIWHKAQTREVVLNSLKKMDIAWAWRVAELELVTHELSTKVLEYGSAGLPTLLMDNDINLNLLSKEYPLFAREREDIISILEGAIKSQKLLKSASEMIFKASQNYMFANIRKNHIYPLFKTLAPKNRVKTILIAGHDLKFIDDLIVLFKGDNHKILIDKWMGHNKHNESKSQELLKQADIIICEWALGNSVWYSKNRLKNQKLIIRFHRQEIETNYPKDIDMSRVYQMIFVSNHYKQKALKQFGWRDENISVIGNYIDTKRYIQSKINNSTRFNIGIIGIVPKMKRFDRALDIIEKLRKRDERFRLFVKGKVADDFPWIKNRPNEIKFYEKQNQRVKNSPYLRDAVIYDGFGKDMPLWFQKIGFILSVSDFESFHMSVADGAYTKTYPIILRWEGSDEIYPKEWTLDSIDEAVEKILELSESKEKYNSEVKKAYEYIQKFSLESIYRRWSRLI